MIDLLLIEEIWHHVSFFLSASDILSFLSSCRTFHYQLGHSSVLWRTLLLQRHHHRPCDLFSIDSSREHHDVPCENAEEKDNKEHRHSSTATRSCRPTTTGQSTSVVTLPESSCTDHQWFIFKRRFLIQDQLHQLKSAQWVELRHRISYHEEDPYDGINREVGGRLVQHNICVLGNTIVLTGGMVGSPHNGLSPRDNIIYIQDTTFYGRRGNWMKLHPYGDIPNAVIHATLTALDHNRAIRFGGYAIRAGASNQVAILTLHDNDERNSTSSSSRNSNDSSCWASWEIINCQGIQLTTTYVGHSATLLYGRYLLVLGGEEWEPIMLDTKTWTFYSITRMIRCTQPDPPLLGEGSNVVWDAPRHRLVIFGGGMNSFKLNVWELRLGDWSGQSLDSFLSSSSSNRPWSWNLLHEDFLGSMRLGDNPRWFGLKNYAFPVSQYYAILALGPVLQPESPIVLYNLVKNQFHAFPSITKLLPPDMNWFDTVLVPQHGYLIVNGAPGRFSDRFYLNNSAISYLFDMAPAFNREFE